MASRSGTTCGRTRGAAFPATRWSLVVSAAGGAEGTGARRALEDLIEIYWFPLYAFVRHQGENPAQAEDRVQAFFARLLEKQYLADVDRAKGRFRSFLLASVKHFLSNERAKDRAQKRGGGRPVLSLDAEDAEGRYALEPADNLTPERLFDRRWALALLDQVLARLSGEYSSAGKAKLFEALRGCLTGATGECRYASIAAQLGMTEGAVKSAAHRLRKRYRAVLRDEIAQTVESAEQVEEEIAYLLNCL